MKAKVIRIRFSEPTHPYDLELNQEVQKLADEAAQVKWFVDLSEAHQLALLRSGREDIQLTLHKMSKIIGKLAAKLAPVTGD